MLPFREARTAPPAVPRLPKARDLAGWILTDPDNLGDNEKEKLAQADDQPDLHSFALGLKHDHQAVLNGLTMPWSSGVVEGNVNRLKMLKRQTYGRASFELLRKRVLLCQ
jgi:transposase